MNNEEIKKKLTFDLWNADFFNTSFMFELEHYAEKYGVDEYPEVYYGWRNLLDRIPKEEALQWLEEICNQIDERKLKYEWDVQTKKFIH